MEYKFFKRADVEVRVGIKSELRYEISKGADEVVERLLLIVKGKREGIEGSWRVKERMVCSGVDRGLK